MSEARAFEVGKTVEHKTNKRRAQIVTLDKGTMVFRPMFEESPFGPAHLAEPQCLEQCSEWNVVEPKAAEGAGGGTGVIAEATLEDTLVDAAKLLEAQAVKPKAEHFVHHAPKTSKR